MPATLPNCVGTVDVSLFCPKMIYWINDRLLRVTGTGPINKFADRSTLVRADSEPKVVGTLPVRPFEFRVNEIRARIDPIVVGIELFNEFEPKSRAIRLLSPPIDNGIVPEKLTLLSKIVLGTFAVIQLIPSQLQIFVVGFPFEHCQAEYPAMLAIFVDATKSQIMEVC